MLTYTLTDLAMRSGLYPKSTPRQWLRHINFCVSRNQVVYIKFFNTVIGFATWFRTDNLKKKTMEAEGKYAVVPLIYIDPEYRKLVDVRKLLREEILKNFMLGKFTGVEYVVWERRKKDKLWRMLSIEEGKIRRKKWVIVEQR